LTHDPKPAREGGPARLPLAPPFDRLLPTWGVTILILAAAFIHALRLQFGNPESFFLAHQDLPILALYLGFSLALGLLRVDIPWLNRIVAARPRASVLGLAALVLGVGAAGAPLLFGGYTLSLDEFAANFDAQIFARGQLMARIAPEWRPFVPALQPIFILETPDKAFWASGYLPINAAVRALGQVVGLQDLVNPLWSALSVVALWGVARRLWPARPGMALGAAALLATSSQLVVMSMTAYAMSAHLALNLVWLWCFLRGGKLGHGAAMVVGFFACGLHQLLFHPLFVAPFIVQLGLDRRWRLAALYAAVYAAIGIFWIQWWPLDMKLAGVPPQVGQAYGAGHFTDTVLMLLGQVRADNVGPMAQSLVRFVSWQNLLTIPLALSACLPAIRAKGVLRALALGVLITIVAMLVLEPTPMHGWGYRYLHGLMGSVCLLAAWGWTQLTDPLPPDRKAAAKTAFVIACALSLFVAMPVRAWQAWRYVEPYAAASAAIEIAPSQVVIIDRDYRHWFDVGTITRNDPFLTRGPKVMMLSWMNDADVRAVCARYSISVFDGEKARALGIDLIEADTVEEGVEQRALMAQLHCGHRLP